MTVTAEQVRNILKLHKKNISTKQAEAFLDIFGDDLQEDFRVTLNKFVAERFGITKEGQ